MKRLLIVQKSRNFNSKFHPEKKAVNQKLDGRDEANTIGKIWIWKRVHVKISFTSLPFLDDQEINAEIKIRHFSIKESSSSGEVFFELLLKNSIS